MSAPARAAEPLIADLTSHLINITTGFSGTNDSAYRMEAWDFIIAGGGLFNNLDYSFTVGHEDGSFVYPASQPGGGSPALRRQLGYLRQFIGQFDFLHLRPDPALLQGTLPPATTARALVKPGEEYAIYVRTFERKAPGQQRQKSKFADAELVLAVGLPEGEFSVEWLDTKQGAVAKREKCTHPGGVHQFAAPPFEQDIALALRRIHGAGPARTGN